VGYQGQLPAPAGHELKVHLQIMAATVAVAIARMEAVLTHTVEQGHMAPQPGGVVLRVGLQAEWARRQILLPAVAESLVGGGTAVENLKQITVGKHHICLAGQHDLPQQIELLIDVKCVHISFSRSEVGGCIQINRRLQSQAET
jgi:hypothetical protein